MIRTDIYARIERERKKQADIGWSWEHDNHHTTHDWVAIIIHELGPLVCAQGPVSERIKAVALLKVAAVAVAGLETVCVEHLS